MIADLILGILIGLGIYNGYKKGLLVVLITLLAFVIAVLSAFKLLHTALQWLQQYLPHGSFTVVLAFIVTFTLVFVLIMLLGKLLKRTIDYTFLGAFDQIAGAILGGLEGAFAVSMLLWLCHNSKIDVLYTEYTKGSVIYPYVLAFGPEFVHWVSYVIPFKDILTAIRRMLQTE